MDLNLKANPRNGEEMGVESRHVVPRLDPWFPAQAAPTEWLEGGVALLNVSGEIVQVNAALAEWLKQSTTAMAGQRMELVLRERCASWKEAWAEINNQDGAFAQSRWSIPCAGDEPNRWFDVELTRHDGGGVFRLTSALPLLPEVPEVEGDRSMSIDARRRELFVRLMRAEEHLNQLVERWPGIVFTQRPDGSFYFISPKIEGLTGLPRHEWMAQPARFWDVIVEADQPLVTRQMGLAKDSTGPVACTFRIRHITTGKLSFVVEERKAIRTSGGLLLGYEGTWLDVTLQTLLENRVRAAAWKETLASMTMGLAHNFRNVLTGISLLTETLQRQLDEKHPLQRTFGPMQTKTREASDSVRWLLECHYGRRGEKSYVDANKMVGELVEMSRFFLPRQVTLETSLAEGTLTLYVDVFELRRVFICMLVNAGEGITNGKRLRVATSRHTSAPEVKLLKGSFPRLPALCIALSDEGAGVPVEQIPRLLESFFEAESLHKSAALAVHSILEFLEKHEGAFSVEPGESSGMTLRLWLPEADFEETE